MKSGRARQDEGYYLQPASSLARREHRRGYTIGSTKDSDRLMASDRETRDRMDRGGYRSSGMGGGRGGYYLDQPLVRQAQGGDDRAFGYEYNDRGEQMYRDVAPRPRRDSYNAARPERPSSMTGIEDLQRVPVSGREPGPPVSMRGFDTLGRASSLRQDRHPREEYVREPTRDEFGQSNRKPARAQVALHQPADDRHAPYSLEKDYEVRQPKLPKPVVEPKLVVEPKPIIEERVERLEPKPRDPHDDHYGRSRDDRSRRHHEKSHRDHDPVDDRDRRRNEDRDRRREERHQDDRHRDIEPVEDRDRRKEERHRDPDPLDNRNHRTEDGHRKAEPYYERERRREDRRSGLEPVNDRDRRRNERQREKREHGDDGRRGEAAMLGAAGLAATGLAAEGVRQHRAHRDDHDRLAVPPDPSESTSVSASVEGSDEERRERHRRRRREREERRVREEREAKELREAEDRKRRERDELTPRDLAPPRDQEGRLRESISYERHPHDQEVPIAEPSHRSSHRHHYAHTQDKDSYSESSHSDSELDDPPRQVRVVTPTNEPSEPKEPPKSILRPPRERFPEDPAPVREGVAPLKDAGKKGIPPNARWTKIDRKLVNPEALEQGNERFEERSDYVIVLRVLTKEEIEQYALKTSEIRNKRGLRPPEERVEEESS